MTKGKTINTPIPLVMKTWSTMLSIFNNPTYELSDIETETFDEFIAFAEDKIKNMEIKE